MTPPAVVTPTSTDPGRQAFVLLRALFTAAPILFGLLKFTSLMDWSTYLWSGVTDALPLSSGSIMMVVGVVEIVAGLVVAFRPRLGAYVVAAWLATVVVNLLLVGDLYDIVARDLGLLVAALALARLAAAYATVGQGRS